MENQEIMQESYSASLPLLPRLDRLDRLLKILEEKHSFSRRHLYRTEVEKTDKEEEGEEEDKCKTLSSALDEVQHKGTLLERLAVLENRVLQLSIEMAEGNTSKSSSTVACSEKLDPAGSETSMGHSEQEKEENMILQRMQSTDLSLKGDQAFIRACDLKQKGHNTSRRQSQKTYKKRWLGWLRMRC